jgi:TatD DNase family protein
MHGMQAVRHAVYDIKEFIETNRQSVYAVGEVGLDYCRQTLQQGQEEESCKAAQDYAFIEQIRLATDYSLPLNVHSRQAGHYAIERLRRMNAQRVLMHAFDGSWRYVSQALQAGFYFSIPPSIVRSSTGGGAMNGWVKRVPLDRLLLESDSPALGPVKGERNQPWNCLITARFLASLHGCPLGSILQQTRMNAIKLFGVTNL